MTPKTKRLRYLIYAKNENAQRLQQKGMVELLHGMKSKFPGVRLLFNRGFEILDQTSDLTDGVVAESLFKSWDPGRSVFKDVPEDDRIWLTNKLTEVHRRYHLPIIVLDYLPPEQRELAKSIALKIKALGFVPWISTPGLNHVGVGEIDI